MSARTICTVTLPDQSKELLQDGHLVEAFEPALFHTEDQEAMKEVSEFAALLDDDQRDVALAALAEHVWNESHRGNVHFMEYKSGYGIEGIGLEIKDDTVTEEKMEGPIRVMFVTFSSS